MFLSFFNKKTELLMGLKEEVERENIRVQTDDKELFIFNYTEKCQYEKNWNRFSTMARGLILNKNGQIVARPFDKFFNLEETNQDLDYLYRIHGKPIIEDKMDGSLGIVFWYYDKWNLCTRGSFNSDQSNHAQKHLDRLQKDGYFNELDKKSTHLFEIIFPENRIVVNYGDRDELVYLWSRKLDTGEYYKDAKLIDISVKKYDDVDIHKEVKNHEGYVLFWPNYGNGYRVKIKFPEYVRLHRIMTGLTDKAIFDSVRKGDTIDLAGVPEEFAQKVEESIQLFVSQYDEIDHQTNSIINELKQMYESSDKSIPEKKFYALMIMDKYKDIYGILFSKLNKKDHKDGIWKHIKEINKKILKEE